jgi:hypothetical protein
MMAAILVVACVVHRSAYGACADDLQRLQAQGKLHPNQGDRKKYNKELVAAQQLASSDEVGCMNAVARARKALNASPPQSDPTLPNQPVQPLNQR